jgi:hypothetical protein
MRINPSVSRSDVRLTGISLLELGITLQDVRLELSQQDAEDAKKGTLIVSDITPSSCIVTALELEETQ